MQRHDKLGRPIVVVFGGRHKPKNLEEFKRFVTFTLDTICSRMPSGQEKFVSIADLEGWGYTNSDTRGYLAALSILQDCYPERLGMLLLMCLTFSWQRGRWFTPLLTTKLRRILFSLRTRN